MAPVLTQLFHSSLIRSWTCICTIVGTLAFHNFSFFREVGGQAMMSYLLSEQPGLALQVGKNRCGS